MRRSCVIAAVIAAVGIGSTFEAAAQQRKPEDNIKMRKAAFTVMSWNFGVLAAMAKGQRVLTIRRKRSGAPRQSPW